MSSSPAAPAGTPVILLIRTSAMGDVVHALPALSALRRSLPAARIGWVLDEAFAPLLEDHALLDERIVVPLRRWRRGGSGRATELLTFARRLRAFRADIAIDLMGNHKGALLARLSGARRRIGARRTDRREPASSLWINEPVALHAVHSVDRAMELLAPLGIATGGVDFAPEALACGRGLEPAGDYVYVHPGAAWANKRYPPESWGAVAARLFERRGVVVLAGAAPGEEELADRVVAASRGAARRFEAPSLAHLCGAIRGAMLVLAGDTGAAHLARALARPVIAVHGPTDPARHGPWSAAGGTLHRQLPCSFCHRRMDAPKPCLTGIAPAEIAVAAEALLAGAAV